MKMVTRSDDHHADYVKRFSLFWMIAGIGLFAAPPSQAEVSCERELTANVVALDQPMMFNRLGAQNVNGMMYALRRDVVTNGGDVPLNQVLDPDPVNAPGGGLDGLQGLVKLRPDKRPRPLVLRMSIDDCLTVNFTNLLNPTPNPFNAPEPKLQINDQVDDRHVGFHPQGLELRDIDSDSSMVGKNASSLAAPGETRTYRFFARSEGAFLVTSPGATIGSEGSGGNIAGGLFGAVNVQPVVNAQFYRSQVTEEELRLATTGTTADDHPIINYEATYPALEGDGVTATVWVAEGKAGLPILNMLDGDEIVHSDLNGIVTGPGGAADPALPASTYPLEAVGMRNPTVPNRLEAFREFTVIFFDDMVAAQAFPGWFDDPVMSHTLHGVRDGFGINYTSGGIGAEIIANRLGVGPMYDCLNCAYEEFFLSSFTVGDIGMLVDVPANAGLESCAPGPGGNLPAALTGCDDVGPKATKAFFPDDPSGVHHSYVGDALAFRNLHAGPKEQHIYHLHNHQWLFNANDDNSNYLDAQGIGPGSGYSYWTNFGGSGNRNKTVGDAIFHCHFYPHFAQGMWEMWRVHDTMETGTPLQVSAEGGGFHAGAFDLADGTPMEISPGIRARALPDGEIIVGTPIPAVVPLPGKPMAPMPGTVTVVAKDADGDGTFDSSQASVDRGDRDTALITQLNPTGLKNPGYPFWIAGIEHTVGQRSTTPPLDMEVDLIDNKDGGWDGGLPRHTLDGLKAGGFALSTQNRLDFTKVVEVAKPVFFPEAGTDVERAAMAFHAQQFHDTFLPNGTPVSAYTPVTLPGDNPTDGFRTNGAPPVPGAPYTEPCIDDKGILLSEGVPGEFFGGADLNAFWSPGAGSIQFTADNPRVYKAANIQFDAVFNKVGYHYPQQRIIALWEDALPIINKEQPPEPFVIRLNTFDCTEYLHTNLVPEYYELDDYQVRTPTDIIGQHIHLPKWDLVAADGSGNGWNYEDGTLSPGTVRERIHAINRWNAAAVSPQLTDVEGNPVVNSAGHELTYELHPLPHPFFGTADARGACAEGAEGAWCGARTTIQRWFADPVVNVAGEDRGLGIIFTHDHYGPSTHQQVGLYATVLTEPAGSTWVHNETGVPMYTRDDGGPTSWQAVIKDFDAGGLGQPASDEPFREFYLEFSDFQHAYQPGVYVGADEYGEPFHTQTEDFVDNLDSNGLPGTDGIPDTAVDNGFRGDPLAFRDAISPSIKQEITDGGAPADNLPDIFLFPPVCDEAGIVSRPCPEAVSADDPGMLVVNYRNEPVGLRVYDPLKLGPDAKPGTQADGLAGDLAFALASRTDRAIAELNVQPTGLTNIAGTQFPPPINAGGVLGGDPFTPVMRAYPGDKVAIKMQSGAQEEEHNGSVHGLKWLQSGSGHGKALNSGWRNSQAIAIAEQFTFNMPVSSDPQSKKGLANAEDYGYSTHTGMDGWWNGTWGILRSHLGPVDNLVQLGFDRAPNVTNRFDFVGVCPATEETKGMRQANRRVPANLREYTVIAMLANELLDNSLGVSILPNDDAADLEYTLTAAHQAGGRLDAEGGTLVANPRATSINHGKAGPLHDPTAILYVNADDLEPLDPFDSACGATSPRRGKPGKACGFGPDGNGERCNVENPTCAVKLRDDAPLEPLTLRAAAGDCIETTLYNRLPEVAPDLASLNTLWPLVRRDRDHPDGMTSFQNNLIRPSSHVGLHAQLVEYDVTQHDGVVVGTNLSGMDEPGTQTVGPVSPDGKLAMKETYRWYAGELTEVPDGSGVRIVATPIEFGGINLMPADKIKQGQKGLIGALIIEPQGATWPGSDGSSDLLALEQIRDRQKPVENGTIPTRGTRADMTVTVGEDNFEDLAVIMQKGLSHRYADGTLVETAGGGEGPGFAEDSQDMGQYGINYGSEPLWFRFGLNPNSPFGSPGFGGVVNAHQAYSNDLPDQVGGSNSVGDPVTPVFTAEPGQETRMRVLMPHGTGRGTTFNLHGHVWQRDPYVCPGQDDLYVSGKCTGVDILSTDVNEAVGSQAIGWNRMGHSLGGQESINSHTHFEVILRQSSHPHGDHGLGPLPGGAGGANGVEGDYLFRDQASFGNLGGLWGILRVEPPPTP